MSDNYTPKYKVGDIVIWVPVPGESVDCAAKITAIVHKRYCYMFIRHDRKACLGQIGIFPFEGLEQVTRSIPSPSKVWADLNND